MRKFTKFLAPVLAAALLAGCAGTAVIRVETPESASSSPAASSSPSSSSQEQGAADGVLKTGLAVSTGLSSSKDAGDEAGLAQADVTYAAVTVDESGVIRSCKLDSVQVQINFDASGAVTTPADAEFLTKNELGDEYGMKKASGIGKEWYEQAEAFCEYAVGKTAEELRGMAVNEKGAPADADIASSVTVSVGGFIDVVARAAESASVTGASEGDELRLVSTSSAASSKSAGEQEGLAQADVSIAAVTWNGDTVTSCVFDAVQAKVNFDASGAITTDVSQPVQSKNELGDGYGMKEYSGIGKEWYEQAAAFAAYAQGKTLDEITGIAVNEKGAPADADIASSVTISVGGFTALLEKAAQA